RRRHPPWGERSVAARRRRSTKGPGTAPGQPLLFPFASRIFPSAFVFASIAYHRAWPASTDFTVHSRKKTPIHAEMLDFFAAKKYHILVAMVGVLPHGSACAGG